jgi:hypothetical protein
MHLVRLLPWLGVGAALLLLQLARPGVFESMDFIRFHSLNEEYLWTAIRAGRLPLWNPHVALGRPFLADVETAFFYPPYGIHLLLPMRAAVCVLLAMHSALGGWALTGLARALGVRRYPSLALALVFFVNGMVVEMVAAGQILYYAGVCYLPLVLWQALRLQDAFSRRQVALLGVVLTLQLLATHPQMFWMTCVACTVLMLCRGLGRPWRASLRKLARVLGGQVVATLLAFLVAAVQWLPFIELIQNGNRQARTVDFAGTLAWPVHALASLAYVVPTGNWSDNLYMGSLACIAGITGIIVLRGRNARGLMVLALLGIVVGLGTATPLFNVAFHVLPGLSFFRIHGRMGILVMLALTLAAGLLFSNEEVDRLRTAVIAALVCLLAVAAALLDPRGSDAVPRAARALGLAISGGFLSLWLLGPARANKRRLAAGLALVALVAAGELAQGSRVAKAMVVARKQFPEEAQVEKALRSAGLLTPGAPPPRVSIPFPWARENAGMHFGWSTFSGYVGLWLGRTWDYVHTAAGLEVPKTSVAFPASNIYRSTFPYDSVSLVLGIDPASGRGGLRSRSDPRAYVASAAAVTPDWHQAIEAMRRGHDYHRIALIEAPLPGLSPMAKPVGGEARILAFAPERIDVEVRTLASGLLVLAESYYPGWSATVNGQAVPCVPANGWMRAVPVPAGTSRVVLRFRSTYLAPGAAVSALALTLLGLLAFAPRKRRA